MSAAKFLFALATKRTALVAATCFSTTCFASTRRTTHLDTPPAARDVSLISYARKVQARTDKAHPAATHSKKGDAEIIDRSNDVDIYAPAFEDDDESAWGSFSRDFDNVLEGIVRIKWLAIGDKITEFVLPSWAKFVPEYIQKLQFELTMTSGTLADDIWQEAHDADINPEIMWNATVRVGDTLGTGELQFRQKRKQHMVKAFAKYLDIPEDEINTADLPTIAMCGSGGGLRAMVAGTSSYLCTQEAGLFDCVMYTAGVSGSCWLQTLFYSSVGKQNHGTLLKHLKSRIGTHIAFPPPALKLVTSAPTNKFILSGFVEKLKGDPGATFGLVDVYSLLLAARLMVPHGDLDVRDNDLKLSNQREYIENGEYPMPIYTVVRHEIPVEEVKGKDKPDTPEAQAKAKEKARREAWFQWIELHPWEVWCEEFGSGIPTWSLGRPFEKGINKLVDTGIALPEIRQSLLLGIYGSAFCATLSHYYKEIRPLLAGMAIFNGLDGMLEEKNRDLVKIHPIEPATIPNWAYGMKDKLPSTCPESVLNSDHLQVMDAGMSNNLPIYPLLRPGRDVDIIIAFDASADIQQENWLSVVDGYAKQRGIKGWPVGAGWPKSSATPEENARLYQESEASSPQQAAQHIAEAREGNRQKHGDQQQRGESPTTGTHRSEKASGIGHCNIWVGVKEERESDDEPPPSKLLSWDNSEDTTFYLMEPNAGTAVIYFPFLPNPKVADIHPDQTDYLSTWNFIYTPEQIDKVVDLARQNFADGAESTKRTVRAVYERKKVSRLQREDNVKMKWWRKKILESGDGFS